MATFRIGNGFGNRTSQLCVATHLAAAIANEYADISSNDALRISYDMACEDLKQTFKNLGSEHCSSMQVLQECAKQHPFESISMQGDNTTSILNDLSLYSPCTGVILISAKNSSVWKNSVAFYIDDTCPQGSEYHLIDAANGSHHKFTKLTGLDSLEMCLYQISNKGTDDISFIRVDPPQSDPEHVPKVSEPMVSEPEVFEPMVSEPAVPKVNAEQEQEPDRLVESPTPTPKKKKKAPVKRKKAVSSTTKTKTTSKSTKKSKKSSEEGDESSK